MFTNRRVISWRRIGQSRGRQMVASPEIHLDGSPSRAFFVKQAIAAGCSFQFTCHFHLRVHSIHKHRLKLRSYFYHHHMPAHVTAVANKGPGLAGTSTFHSPPKLLRLSNIPSLSLSRNNLQAAARRVRIVYLLGPNTTSSRPSHTRRPLRPLSSCRPNARPPPPLALARQSAWRQV
jgi:hypothetical protein